VSSAFADLEAKFAVDDAYREFETKAVGVEFEVQYESRGMDNSWVHRSAGLFQTPWWLRDEMVAEWGPVDPYSFVQPRPAPTKTRFAG
jgi:hypothetical protein